MSGRFFDCLVVRITMISKCIAFLVAALMLANCCALGNGCVPAAGSPVAWDGLGSAPTDDTQPLELRPKQHARAKGEVILGSTDAAAAEPNSRGQPKDSWEQQQAVDRADEARLKHTPTTYLTSLSLHSARPAPP